MAASLANLRRPAFARAGLRRSRAQVRVVAFKDTHRAQELVDTASEFAAAWANGHREGPSDAVMYSLKQICDENIHVTASHPQGGMSFKGLDGVRAKLTRHQETASGSSTSEQSKAEIVLAAANDDTDTAFCLVRLPADQSEEYMLLKMEVLLDDGVRLVTSVVERSQLCSDSADQSGKNDENGQATSGAVPFPRDLIKPWNNNEKAENQRLPARPEIVTRVQDVVNAWNSARNSKVDVSEMMEKAGCDNDFKLIDGNGAAQSGSGNGKQQQPGAVGYPGKEIGRVLEALKSAYDVDCQLVDSAVCLDEAAAFTHWRATQKNRDSGQDWQVEGMEVNILCPETGNLKAVYVLRDSLKQEELETVKNNAVHVSA